MNLTTTLSWLGVFVVLVLVAWVASGQRVDEEIRTDEANSKYGIELGLYQPTSCLNGWLIAKNNTHSWMYVRDENFEPIRCK